MPLLLLIIVLSWGGNTHGYIVHTDPVYYFPDPVEPAQELQDETELLP